MRKKLFCLCILLFLTACNISDSEENPSPADIDKPDTTSKETAETGLNQLGFEALSRLDMDDNGNLFISPISIWTALNMAYHGADGETKAEMEEALGIESIDAEDLMAANHALLTEQVADSEEIELHLANAAWYRDDMQIDAAYQEALESYYLAQIEPLTTPEAINDWVAGQTNDRIDKMIDDISPDLLLFLLNAVYFKGDWTYPFHENMTAEQEFHLADGSTTETPMMTLNKRDLDYWEEDDIQAVSLPYGEEGTIQMQIFLPSEDMTFSDFQENFTLEDWQETTDALENQKGTVLLPSFTLEYESQLNNLFIQLGMEQAFNPDQADLSNMFEAEGAPAYISEIYHKTFIDVNEEGTEAAGATSVTVEETSAVIEDTFRMEINRPFLFTITNTEEDIILFMGSIGQPVQE